MNKNRGLSAIAVPLLICLCILCSFTSLVNARDAFAPSWLKEGTYAKYTTDRASGASLFDINSPDYRGLNWWNASSYDSLSYLNATLMWRCISINDAKAEIEVTFDYIGKQLIHNSNGVNNIIPLSNASQKVTGKVYVDLYTRGVYTSEGDLLAQLTYGCCKPTRPRG
jgi:hypothetical protein